MRRIQRAARFLLHADAATKPWAHTPRAQKWVQTHWPPEQRAPCDGTSELRACNARPSNQETPSHTQPQAPTPDAAFGCNDAPWRCSAMLHDACLLYLPRRPTCPPSAAQLGRRGRRLPRRRAQAGNWRLHAPQRASCVDCSALVAPGARRGARATPGVAALLRLGLEARAAR